MPRSIFLSGSALELGSVERAAVRERDALIARLPRYPDPGPEFASTCYVWPTSDCAVGCSHCNFAAPPHSSALDRYRVADHFSEVLRVVNGMGLWKAVLSGGGEPLMEPDFCREFIHGVHSPALEEIELITSAHAATSQRAADQVVDGLVEAWRSRGSDVARAVFGIRLSVDWFHAKRLGVKPAARMIRALGRDGFEGVGCYVRSVLLENDDTLLALAQELGASLGDICDYQQRMTLPDGRTILVYYKNLIFDGRMNRRRIRALPVALPSDARVANFSQRFRGDDGRHVPARVYNGPKVVHLDGLACVLEDDGSIKILEGNHPHRHPTLRTVGTWTEAIDFLYMDPLSVYLVDNGPEALAELIGEEYPDAHDVEAQTNQLYYLTDRLLANPVVALFATLRVLECHIAGGQLPGVDIGSLRLAWDTWMRLRKASGDG